MTHFSLPYEGKDVAKRQERVVDYLGGYSAEVPSLPIPNRVIKLSIADGTAIVGE